jgi:hypothetical protein|nr:MAG: putative minor capsid protein [Lake Baikal virophage 10]
MSQLDIRRIESNPDKVYYDLTIANVNNGDVNPANSPVLVFNEQRQNSIINNTGDYYLSIVRFQVDTTSLPIIVPVIQTYGEQLPNVPTNSKTIYSVTILDNTTTPATPHQVYIDWKPQIKNIDVPEPPAPTASSPLQAESEWYFCYNFEWFVNLVNTALQTALTDALIPTGIAFLGWNTTTNSASLYLDQANFSTINAPLTTPNYSLYFNQSLFTLFSSFPATYYGSVGVTDGLNYNINIPNTQGLNTIILPVIPAPIPAPITCIQINQEWDTTPLWTPVSSIVFTSATFPIIPNRLSPPQAFTNGVLVNLNPNANNSNFAQVITDIITGDLCYKPTLIYEPTAEYRLIDMVGNTPLTNINIQVFWKSKLGNFVPFRIATGNSCTMKLLFTKKSSVGNNGNQ